MVKEKKVTEEQLRSFLKEKGYNPWIVAITIAGGIFVDACNNVSIEKDEDGLYIIKEEK